MDKEAVKTRMRESLRSNRWFWAAIGVLVLANLYFMISKGVVRQRLEKEKVQLEEEHRQELRLALSTSARRQLSLMMKTFVWAVRSSMLRDNLDEVDQYFLELIKEKQIAEIVLADRQGRILVSTNKKHEGQAFADLYPPEMLAVEEVTFRPALDQTRYFVSAPVLSLNTRLGTLFLVYVAPQAGELLEQAGPPVGEKVETPGQADTLESLETPLEDSLSALNEQ